MSVLLTPVGWGFPVAWPGRLSSGGEVSFPRKVGAHMGIFGPGRCFHSLRFVSDKQQNGEKTYHSGQNVVYR